MGGSVDEARLTQEVLDLGPWHLDVDVAAGVTTRAWVEAGGEVNGEQGSSHFQNPAPAFKEMIGDIYPAGLDGRAVLDCACNCGAYLLWARDLGAGRLLRL